MDQSTIIEGFKILGGFAGIIALVWRAIDEFGSYLRLSLTTDGAKDGWLTALTIIENKGNRSKHLDNAFLLIGPESENPIETANVIAQAHQHPNKFWHTNDFGEFYANEPLYVQGRAWLPLTFYYLENIGIGDETLTYCAPINAQLLDKGVPYAIRFFIFENNRLHRSVHNCFIN